MQTLQQQAAPDMDIDFCNGNPLNHHYFMALLCEVFVTKIEDPQGRSARLIKTGPQVMFGDGKAFQRLYNFLFNCKTATKCSLYLHQGLVLKIKML